MRYTVCIVLIAGIFFSCEETIELDLRQTEPKIVIEGQITDQPGMQYVKVTKSVGFYTSGQTPRVTNAVITVEDDLGVVYDFEHNPGSNADSAGIYLPAIPFQGETGRIYTLNVTIDGVTYTAQDELLSVIAMDSVKTRLNDDERKDAQEEGKFYELLMYAHEPQDETNFYLFKFYRNDTLIFYNETDIYYSDDELLAENINGLSSPVFYGLGDKARIEMYSISRNGFIYLDDLWSILNNDAGGMFGPIPSSPRTNLSNGALGFFQVSAVTTTEAIVE